MAWLQKRRQDIEALPDLKAAHGQSTDPGVAEGMERFLNRRRQVLLRQQKEIGYGEDDPGTKGYVMDELGSELISWSQSWSPWMPGIPHPVSPGRKTQTLLEVAAEAARRHMLSRDLTDNQAIILYAAVKVEESKGRDFIDSAERALQRELMTHGPKQASPLEFPKLQPMSGPGMVRAELMAQKSRKLALIPDGMLAQEARRLGASPYLLRYMQSEFGSPIDELTIQDLTVKSAALGEKEQGLWRKIASLEGEGFFDGYVSKVLDVIERDEIPEAEMFGRVKQLNASTGFQRQQATIRDEFTPLGEDVFRDYLVQRLGSSAAENRMLKEFSSFMGDKGLEWLNTP